MEAKLLLFSKDLKSNLDDLSFTLDKFLKMHPKSPLSTNYIPQSIPHRLLVILLRRDGLQDYPASAFSASEERVIELAHANNISPVDNENLEGGNHVDMDDVDWSQLYGGAVLGGDVC